MLHTDSPSLARMPSSLQTHPPEGSGANEALKLQIVERDDPLLQRLLLLLGSRAYVRHEPEDALFTITTWQQKSGAGGAHLHRP